MPLFIVHFILAAGMAFAFGAPALADEILRPRSHEDLPDPAFEMAREVVGTEVAWFNRAALVRDFPELSPLSDDELKQWLLQNTSYIGSRQAQLDEIRNSPIPFGNGLKPAFRPRANSPYKRSAVLEVYSPTEPNKIIGMIDAKGFGHGSESSHDVSIQLLSDQPLEKLRIKDHSDGLMSFGEAIAEASRQQAAQDLFDINGIGFETVETYAIIKLPFTILKNNEELPAAIYLRQAHLGRFAGLHVPSSIYTDLHGVRQRTENLTAVDFGGVILTSPLAAPLNEISEYENPQVSKAWRWGHETANAYSRPFDPDKNAVYSHFSAVLGELHRQTIISEKFKAKERRREIDRRYVRFLFSKGYEFAKVRSLYRTKKKKVLSELEEELRARGIAEKDKYIRRALSEQTLRNLKGRTDAQSLAVIAQAMNDEDEVVRQLARNIFALRSDPPAQELWRKLLSDPKENVRLTAVNMLAQNKDPAILPILELALKDSSLTVQFEASKILTHFTTPAVLDLSSIVLDSPGLISRDWALRALEKQTDPRAVDLVAKAYPLGDRFFRFSVMKWLGGRDGSVALDLIEKGLADKDSEISYEAAIALAGRSDPRSLSMIKDLIGKSSKKAQERGARALVGRKDAESLSLITFVFNSDNVSLRESAAMALAGRQGPQVVKLILKALGDEDEGVAVAAAHAIYGQPERWAVPLIQKAFENDSHMVREEAARALENTKGLVSLKIIEPLVFDNKFDYSIWSSAIWALRGRQDERSLEILKQAYSKAKTGLHRQMILKSLSGRTEPAAVTIVESGLKDRDNSVCSTAASLIAAFPWAQARPLIELAIQYSPNRIESDIVAALGHFDNAEAKDLLASYAKNSHGGRVDYKLFKTCPDLFKR